MNIVDRRPNLAHPIPIDETYALPQTSAQHSLTPGTAEDEIDRWQPVSLLELEQ